jgi:hypothetical protein
VDEFRIANRPFAQVEPFLRALEQAVFDRGNDLTTVSFVVRREHDTVEDAELFILEHATELPGSGLVMFEAAGATGAASRRYLWASKVTAHDASYKGRTTIHSYVILGGRIRKEKP